MSYTNDVSIRLNVTIKGSSLPRTFLSVSGLLLSMVYSVRHEVPLSQDYEDVVKCLSLSYTKIFLIRTLLSFPSNVSMSLCTSP